MRRCRTISFSEPLVSIGRLFPVPPAPWEQLLHEREQAAFARGHKAGEASMNQKLIEQRAEIAGHQKAVLDALQNAIPGLVHHAETGLIEVALQAASKLVSDMPISQELVEGTVREALQRVEDSSEVLVKLNPADLTLLQQSDSALLHPETGHGHLRFTAANDVIRGGCLIETRFGIIDARRETKLEQLREAVMES